MPTFSVLFLFLPNVQLHTVPKFTVGAKEKEKKRKAVVEKQLPLRIYIEIHLIVGTDKWP